MSKKELYCFSKDLCDSLSKENASITSRGVSDSSWRLNHDDGFLILIISLQDKKHNFFILEVYV